MHRRCLLLRETQRHIHTNLSPHRYFCGSQAFARAWVFNVGVGNPSEHFLALREHLLGFRVHVRKNLNGDSSIADQWRDGLNNLPVLVFLLLWAQGVARCNSLPNLRIFRDQAWVRGLTINKPDQFLHP